MPIERRTAGRCRARHTFDDQANRGGLIGAFPDTTTNEVARAWSVRTPVPASGAEIDHYTNGASCAPTHGKQLLRALDEYTINRIEVVALPLAVSADGPNYQCNKS